MDPFLFIYGAPDTIRTCDRLVRSQVLYPAELRALRKRHYTDCMAGCRDLEVDYIDMFWFTGCMETGYDYMNCETENFYLEK